MIQQFELQGHRGARGLVAENTLEGFLAALAIGVISIELDVAMAADDVLVVVHDPVLNPDLTRTRDGRWLNEPGPVVRELRLAELAEYDVGRARPGSRVAQAHPGQRAIDGAHIPTLDAVFQATAAAGVIIDVELKTDPLHPKLTASPVAMAEAVMAAARRCHALDRLAVRSFDWRGLFHLSKNQPQVPLGWLTAADTQNENWWGAFAVPGRSVPEAVAAAAGNNKARPCWAPDHADLHEAEIVQAHALGLRVVPWTVNSQDDMARLIKWGVDGLCTDRPDLARLAMTAAGLPLPPPYPGP
jgi:glycerophosphoryl diester phosphodiesterase